MGRVSLTEDYDDRSVISKLNEMDKRVKENTTVVTSAEASAKASAQAAQETADRFAGSVGAVVQNANAQINASKAQVDQAKAEVDTTVTTVAQAVQTANNASASAQQSATTVQGYDDRLTAVETKNSQQDTDISALQTADTNNVKLRADYQQNLTGALVFNGADKIIVKDALNFGKSITIRHSDVELGQSPANVRYWNELIGLDKNGKTRWQIEYDHLNNGDANLTLNLLKNDASTKSGITITKRNNVIIPQVTNLPQGAPSTAIVNKAYVESTDGATNNLVHRSATERIGGEKDFTGLIKRITGLLEDPTSYTENTAISMNTNNDKDIGSIMVASSSTHNYTIMKVHQKGSNNYCKLFIRINSEGRSDLIMETNSQKGYDQHIIYSFGA